MVFVDRHGKWVAIIFVNGTGQKGPPCLDNQPEQQCAICHRSGACQQQHSPCVSRDILEWLGRCSWLGFHEWEGARWRWFYTPAANKMMAPLLSLNMFRFWRNCFWEKRSFVDLVDTINKFLVTLWGSAHDGSDYVHVKKKPPWRLSLTWISRFPVSSGSPRNHYHSCCAVTAVRLASAEMRRIMATAGTWHNKCWLMWFVIIPSIREEEVVIAKYIYFVSHVGMVGLAQGPYSAF